MRQMVDYMERYALGVEDGRRNGAGVRIEDLEQFVPVKSGHTLTFTHEIIKTQYSDPRKVGHHP